MIKPQGAGGDDASAIRNRFRELVLERDVAPSIRDANRLSAAIQAYLLAVRDSDAGRRAIESLMGDSSPSVRLLSAYGTLKWNPALAVPILRDLARQHEHVAGFEARLILRDHEAGSLNLDWVPKPNRRPRSPRRVSATRPTTAQLDAVEAVHATTMSGGFLNSLVVSGPAFADAIAGYEALGLAEAAGLVRQALAALPGAAVPDDHDRRAALIDGLGKDDGATLDRLSDEYQELFPSDEILLDAIEAARGS